MAAVPLSPPADERIPEDLRVPWDWLDVVLFLFFGLGSIGGMMMMSAVVSLPFVFTAKRFEQFSQPIKFVAGMCSVLFGLYYAWQVLSGQPVE